MSSPSKSSALPILRPPSIVVAARDQAIGRMIAMALRLDGYAPHLCADGEEALNFLLDVGCEAAVLDARLATVDGITICRRVRATSSPISSVPIILLHTHSEASLRARGLRAGASAFLFIPFGVQELLRGVAAVMPDRIGL
jgi:DNA-binding response OmpR family regulator